MIDDNGRVRLRYRLLAAFIFCLLILAIVLELYYHNSEYAVPMACPIYSLTGYYCPGCGSGRACRALMHGELYRAFRYNPLMLLLIPPIGVYVLAAGGQWMLTGKDEVSHRIPEWIPGVVLVLVFVYGVIRNIPVFPFSLLAPVG